MLSVVKEHKQIFTSIVEREDHFAGFKKNWCSTPKFPSFCKPGLSQAYEVWQELQPSLARVVRLEELVEACPALKEHVEQAEATFGAGAVLQLVSLVMKSLILSSPSSRKRCSSLPAAFLTIP